MKRKHAGFSLIELMIAVVIVSIITAVAYPSYMQYLLRGNRAKVQEVMMNVAQVQGQFLVDSRAYAASVAATGVTIPADVAAKYTITQVLGNTPPSFTLTATPLGQQAQDTCGTLTLNSAGAKTASGTGKCW